MALIPTLISLGVLDAYDQIDLKLGPDEVFVCGDNRPESVDSCSFGSIQSGAPRRLVMEPKMRPDVSVMVR